MRCVLVLVPRNNSRDSLQVSIQDFPTHTTVIFIHDGERVGPMLRLTWGSASSSCYAAPTPTSKLSTCRERPAAAPPMLNRDKPIVASFA